MVDSAEETKFTTSNTPLAAYLISLGYPMSFIEWTDHRASFIFEVIDSKLHHHIRDFNMLRAEGNINAYEQARRTLVHQVKRETPL